jgi:DNA-binding protein YbaB
VLSAPILDPDGAREQLEAWRGRIDRLATDTKAMSDQLQQLRVTAADRDRIVEVTVDSSGSLIDLTLNPRMARVPSEALARTIMETVREAKRQVAARSQEVIESTLGTDSPAARGIAARVREQLTPPDPTAGR